MRPWRSVLHVVRPTLSDLDRGQAQNWSRIDQNPSKRIVWAVFSLRSGPDGSGQAIGFIWTLFRAKPSILDPFWTIFDVFEPDRTLADVADMSRRDLTSPDG